MNRKNKSDGLKCHGRKQKIQNRISNQSTKCENLKNYTVWNGKHDYSVIKYELFSFKEELNIWK